MSKQYNCLPSDILGIEDDYTAFCFNEACCAFMMHLQNNEKPSYVEHENLAEKPKNYSNFSDFYKNFNK